MDINKALKDINTAMDHLSKLRLQFTGRSKELAYLASSIFILQEHMARLIEHDIQVNAVHPWAVCLCQSYSETYDLLKTHGINIEDPVIFVPYNLTVAARLRAKKALPFKVGYVLEVGPELLVASDLKYFQFHEIALLQKLDLPPHTKRVLLEKINSLSTV